jgi:hypothetical protein
MGINIMIFCCEGSALGVGVIFWMPTCVTNMPIGSRRIQLCSGCERSGTQSQAAPRSSIATDSTLKKAMKKGICSSSGIQPPSGLMPDFWYSAISSAFCSCLRGSFIEMPLYFSLIAAIWG